LNSDAGNSLTALDALNTLQTDDALNTLNTGAFKNSDTTINGTDV
jgi:hypothetical protein